MISKSRLTRLDELAVILREQLSTVGLMNYIKEQQRMIKNELLMSRSPKKYLFYLEAGLMAIDFTKSKGKA